MASRRKRPGERRVWSGLTHTSPVDAPRYFTRVTIGDRAQGQRLKFRSQRGIDQVHSAGRRVGDREPPPVRERIGKGVREPFFARNLREKGSRTRFPRVGEQVVGL